MSLQIQPLADNVLLKLVQAETKTDTGLFIPDIAVSKVQQGTVLAKGIDVANEINVGDMVIIVKHTGQDFSVAKDDVVTLVGEQDILGVIRK